MLTTHFFRIKSNSPITVLLGKRAIQQLSEKELFRDDETGSNPIAMIVKYMAGNIKKDGK